MVDHSQRRGWKVGGRGLRTVGVAGIAAAGLLSAGLVGGVAEAAPAHARPVSYSYRHGIVPTRSYVASHRGQFALPRKGTKKVKFGGGVDGVGVTTGAPKVYLVFWGTQWGTESVNGSGYDTFSGDPDGLAPDLQSFFTGLGSTHDTWSGVATQYCQGVATGATTCPTSNTEHVGYPTGGALAGVWEDTSAAAPKKATGAQIATEAIAAATHFGNTTEAAQLNVQYFVVSPTGTHPDGFNTAGGNFCAWHDYNADAGLPGGAVPSPDGNLAFTNMPYVDNAGAGCGENFVNAGAAGLNDGVTIVGGHEYTETITDQFPVGGWIDHAGEEVGDLCAWKTSGTGKAKDIALSTGSFAVQGIWANDAKSGAGGCETSHPIVTDP